MDGNAAFLPQYVERALAEANKANAGLAFLHSHLGPGWQGMSQDDINAEQLLASRAQAVTGLPLIGLTLGTDHSWSARVWDKSAPHAYVRQWCESVRLVGDLLRLTYAPELRPRPRFRRELSRTVSAWGDEAQAHLARIRVGVVGVGSVGSIVAETLARMGIAYVKLIDFDRLERVNLDRVLHATRSAARRRLFKSDVLAAALRRSATSEQFVVESHHWSICEEQGFREALDCDVLFCCVDRPWPRAVLNLIAYAHLIPVIDGGIYARPKPKGNGLLHAEWKAHVAAPERACLECLGQFDPGLVSAERDGYLDDRAYIAALPADHPVRHNENVFGFSLSAASMEVMHFLSMVVGRSGLTNQGARTYHFIPGSIDIDHMSCSPTCFYSARAAAGDRCDVVLTGRHLRAEAMRERDKSLLVR